MWNVHTPQIYANTFYSRMEIVKKVQNCCKIVVFKIFYSFTTSQRNSCHIFSERTEKSLNPHDLPSNFADRCEQLFLQILALDYALYDPLAIIYDFLQSLLWQLWAVQFSLIYELHRSSHILYRIQIVLHIILQFFIIDFQKTIVFMYLNNSHRFVLFMITFLLEENSLHYSWNFYTEQAILGVGVNTNEFIQGGDERLIAWG
eukprot:TRINITY_DN2241_c1_g1_i1.p1 TRINITY_DN2241_c1_g1~~TRINITY_DN2241_c1_g1_i1.p1  ORF type:complete len:203 (-),score=-7.52 TRINITY_DN2241_c1_g1_i1:349-957(-)